jgi:hypothetical protein
MLELIHRTAALPAHRGARRRPTPRLLMKFAGGETRGGAGRTLGRGETRESAKMDLSPSQEGETRPPVSLSLHHLPGGVDRQAIYHWKAREKADTVHISDSL